VEGNYAFANETLKIVVAPSEMFRKPAWNV